MRLLQAQIHQTDISSDGYFERVPVMTIDQPGPVRKARPVTAGSRIGIIAPASAPRDPQVLQHSTERLSALGFEIVTQRDPFPEYGYLAGTDEDRIEELNTFLNDPTVDALFSARGGYGCLRILDRVDYEAARRHPKVLIGYSDITALHMALYTHAGWVGISGPMPAVDWPAADSPEERILLELLNGGQPVSFQLPGHSVLSARRPGVAEGRLLGGNLSMLVRLLGTPYFPDMNGAILFIEEVSEIPYRIDALFAQLRHAGILDCLAGVVLGQFTDCVPRPGRASLSLEQIFDNYFEHASYPVAEGLMVGHIKNIISIPVGVRAALSVDSSSVSLTLLESVVE